MSKAFKAVGKVFKSVLKVVKKIAVPALIIGAIVLTGGAAIGALPALGTILGSIGITGTMAGVLGGAISGVAMGAATGAIGGLLSGKGLWKSIKSGAIMGGLTGGVLGGLGAISPNGILSDMGVGSKLSHLQGLADAGKASASQLTELATLKAPQADLVAGAPAASAPSTIQPIDPGASSAVGDMTRAPTGGAPGTGTLPSSVASAPGVVDPTAVASVPGVTSGNVAVPGAPVVAAPGTGGGIMNNPMAMMMGGQVISGLGSGLTGMMQAKDAKRDRASYDIDYQAVSPYAPNGQTNSGLTPLAEKYPSAVPYRYDPASGRVVPA